MAEKLETKKNTTPVSAAPAGKAALAAKPAEKAAKPKGKVSAGGVIAVFLIVIIIAATAMVFFNLGGVRQQLVDALQTGQAQEGETASLDAAQIEQRQSELDAQAAQLEEQSAALKEKTDKLKEREQALEDNEKALADRETALAAREEAVTSAETSMQEAQQAQDDITAAAKIFEAMDPVVAATAISGLSTVDEIVSVLLLIPSDKAADILGNMEVKLATKVLSEMMK